MERVREAECPVGAPMGASQRGDAFPLFYLSCPCSSRLPWAAFFPLSMHNISLPGNETSQPKMRSVVRVGHGWQRKCTACCCVWSEVACRK